MICPGCGANIDAGSTFCDACGARITHPEPPDGRIITIGREADNTIALDAVQVSRYHARVFLDGHQLTIEDLGGANGTTINGAAVRRSPLRLTDRVQFGSFDFDTKLLLPLLTAPRSTGPLPAQAPASLPPLLAQADAATVNHGWSAAPVAGAALQPAPMPSPMAQPLVVAPAQPVIQALPARGAGRAVGILLALVLVGGGGYCLFFHTIQTSDGFSVLKKAGPGFAHTYVDLQSWGIMDVVENWQLAAYLVLNGYGSYLPHADKLQRLAQMGARAADVAQLVAGEAGEKLRARLAGLKRGLTSAKDRLAAGATNAAARTKTAAAEARRRTHEAAERVRARASAARSRAAEAASSARDRLRSGADRVRGLLRRR